MLFKKILLLSLFLLVLVLSMGTVNASAIDTMQENLNMEVADIMMIVVSCGIIVIVAFDARIALMCAFLIYASITRFPV
ncbi:unnamed protein product [marine sediment metagenome]|uniref:Uncharacterized protein n=1 Tax=marine sediment metagenome TaxID=412755 RepID=X1AW75_9ZZZZ